MFLKPVDSLRWKASTIEMQIRFHNCSVLLNILQSSEKRRYSRLENNSISKEAKDRIKIIISPEGIISLARH